MGKKKTAGLGQHCCKQAYAHTAAWRQSRERVTAMGWAYIFASPNYDPSQQLILKIGVVSPSDGGRKSRRITPVLRLR